MADITEDVCAVVNEELIEKVLKNDYGFINGKVKKLDGYDDRNYYIKVRIHTHTYIYIKMIYMTIL